jgi:Fuc2NAc and GlcNAc transferase
MTLVIWLALVIVSSVLVGGYRKLAMRRGWFDIPNQRSSHTEIVPRGAGVIHALLILLATCISLLWMGERWTVAASLAPGLAVAIIGWLDDVRGIAARWRFLIYATACWGAVSIIFLNDGNDYTNLVLISLIAVSGLALLWLVNLYNFMDGINGIAVAEGIFVSVAALWLGNDFFQADLTRLLLVIIATLLGFLPWNFPRARVFMGDVGSAFLGFCFGVLALWSIVSGVLTVSQWLILGGVFIVDASYTLSVRVLTGQRWHEAHRSHAYQRLANFYHSHTKAVCVLMAVNVGWLLPWAWFIGGMPNLGWIGLLLSYLPLLLLCRCLRAGQLTGAGY